MHENLHGDFDAEPVGLAILALIVNVVVGVALAILVGATRTTDGSGFRDVQWAVMTEQPLENADKAFNWLILAFFVASGLVCAFVAWAGGSIVNAQRRTARHLLPVGSDSGKPLSPPLG